MITATNFITPIRRVFRVRSHLKRSRRASEHGQNRGSHGIIGAISYDIEEEDAVYISAPLPVPTPQTLTGISRVDLISLVSLINERVPEHLRCKRNGSNFALRSFIAQHLGIVKSETPKRKSLDKTLDPISPVSPLFHRRRSNTLASPAEIDLDKDHMSLLTREPAEYEPSPISPLSKRLEAVSEHEAEDDEDRRPRKKRCSIENVNTPGRVTRSQTRLLTPAPPTSPTPRSSPRLASKAEKEREFMARTHRSSSLSSATQIEVAGMSSPSVQVIQRAMISRARTVNMLKPSGALKQSTRLTRSQSAKVVKRRRSED